MLAVERRNKIEQLINEHGSVQVVELAKLFDVTTETIRGDLLKLEHQGILERSYGGATLAGNDIDPAISERGNINLEEKIRIAKSAVSLIRTGEIIFLDSSTTSWHLSRQLKHIERLTVITNAQKVVNELTDCENIQVICTGGILNRKNMSYTGRSGERTIRENYHVDKAFLSCRGVTIESGIVDSSEAEAEIKRAMVENSSYSVFMCDHSKFTKTGFAKVTDFSKIKCLVTDGELDDEWKTVMEKYDINVINA